MRNYKYLQMFTHAEKLIDDNTDLRNGETSVFIRFGSDYRNNYYEYEVPFGTYPSGTYNTYNSTRPRDCLAYTKHDQRSLYLW